jgi:hypothetical protein
LLVAAAASSQTFRGLSGRDRWALYLTALGTGIRVRALAGLTPGDFDLPAETPVVVLPARLAKNKKAKTQPLPADVAEALGVYLADKPTSRPAWPGGWKDDGAEMIRLDLAAAGIAYTVEGPDGPLHADFHALRHSYLTLLGRGGVDLRTAQEWAGHSTPTLTARYSHRRLHDLAGAVHKLPRLTPASGAETVQKQATRTDGRGFGCSMVAQSPVNQGHFEASAGIGAGLKSEVGPSTEPIILSPFSTPCHPSSSSAPSRTRTANPLIKSQLLYRLS